MPAPLTTVNLFSEKQANYFKTIKPVVLLPMLTGTASTNTVYDIDNTPNQASNLFGDGSMLQFVLDKMKYIDKTYGTGTTKISAIAIPDGQTSATATLTITGTPAEAGTFDVRVIEYDKKYSISYTTSSTPTTIATSIANTINAYSKRLVDATANANVITLTTRNKSAQFNNEPLIVEGVLNGLSIAVGNFTGGVDNTLASGFLNDFDNEAVEVITTFSNYKDCAEKLATKFNVDGKVVDGIPFVIETNTLTSFIAKPSISDKKGVYSALLSYTDNMGNKMSKASKTFSLECLVSFYMFRVLKMQTYPTINTAKFLPINEWGARSGVHMAKRPFSKMSILECQPNNSRFNLSKDEQDNLKAKGFAYFGVDDLNQNIEPYNIIMSSIQIDPIFSHLNDYDVMAQVRSYLFKASSDFVAEKYLGPDGQNNIGVLTAQTLKAEMIAWLSDLASEKYNLLANADILFKTFEEQLQIDINLEQGTIDVAFNLYHNAQISRQTFNLTITKKSN